MSHTANYIKLVKLRQNAGFGTSLDTLEVIQNKALGIATGCHQKAAASHLRAETGALPLRAPGTVPPPVLYERPPTPTPQSPNRNNAHDYQHQSAIYMRSSGNISFS